MMKLFLIQRIFIILKENNNIMEKLEITTPEGYKRVETTKNEITYVTFEKIKNKAKGVEEYWRDVVKNYINTNIVYWVSPSCEIQSGTISPTSDRIKNAHLTLKRAKAFVMLQALVTARDYYNEGWVADWTDPGYKYVLQGFRGDIRATWYSHTDQILNFKTAEIRDKFLKDFKEWIVICHKERLL